MNCVDRYEKYKKEDLDTILVRIRNGSIKCGRYAGLVKIDKNYKLKGKEFFNDGGKEEDG